MSAPGLLPASWQVRLPAFEGPLDLLLHLVKLHRVEISDIPVAAVCEQFQEYLRLMEETNLDIAAEYIYEAALLIHLKSKLLLPSPASPGESAEDPRHELVSRLLEYQRLKDAAQSLAEVHQLRRGMWTRRRGRTQLDARPGEEGEDLDLSDVSLYDLLSALRDVLLRYDREHPDPLTVPRESFSVREQLERLLRLLVPGRPFDLVDDLRGRSCRAEAVAGFLAVLELARLGLVRLQQAAGGSILLHRTPRELAREELEAIQA